MEFLQSIADTSLLNDINVYNICRENFVTTIPSSSAFLTKKNQHGLQIKRTGICTVVYELHAISSITFF